MSVLFLIASPLHAFVSLGLMRGPFAGQRHALVFIGQRPQEKDYIVDALNDVAPTDATVVCFPQLGASEEPRATLARITAFARDWRPATIAVGNDRRTEFYACLRGAPDARRTYIDDGLYSYLPRHDATSAWGEGLKSRARAFKYGFRVERPAWIGGSRAVQDAFVLLPDEVHAGLRGKTCSAIRREWFADAFVRGVCSAAAAGAGVEPATLVAAKLLLLLPNERMFEVFPGLRERVTALVAEAATRGERVTVKAHPASGRLASPLAGLFAEVPIDWLAPRLPAEVLVPLLAPGTRIVGSLTTTLLTMALLGDRLDVQSLEPPRPVESAADRYGLRLAQIYRSVGIKAVESA